MSNTPRALLSALLTLMIIASPASAQLGPSWDESATSQTERLTTQSQPIVAPVIQPAQTQTQTQTQVQGQTTPESAPETITPVTQSTESKPLGLPRARRTTEESQSLGDTPAATPLKLGKEFIRTVATLAGVLMLIFALAHVYKRIARTKGGLSGQIGAGGRAPAGLVEVLGRYPISSGMTLVVMRFDRKVLLLSHANAGRGKRAGTGSMQTLCEMSGPEEVASILGKVRDAAGDSIAASFERTLQEAGNATDQEIEAAMYQPVPGMHVQRPRRVAPGFVSNDEGDRLELTSLNDSPAASQVLRRRLGAMRRGN